MIRQTYNSDPSIKKADYDSTATVLDKSMVKCSYLACLQDQNKNGFFGGPAFFSSEL